MSLRNTKDFPSKLYSHTIHSYFYDILKENNTTNIITDAPEQARPVEMGFRQPIAIEKDKSGFLEYKIIMIV